jgi:hypothetical protein
VPPRIGSWAGLASAIPTDRRITVGGIARPAELGGRCSGEMAVAFRSSDDRTRRGALDA